MTRPAPRRGPAIAAAALLAALVAALSLSAPRGEPRRAGVAPIQRGTRAAVAAVEEEPARVAPKADMPAFRGRVVDASDGSPVSGLSVTVRAAGAVLSAHTDASGEFAAPATAPPDPSDVLVEADAVALDPTEKPKRDPGGVELGTFRTRRLLPAALRVVDAAWSPVAGCRVELYEVGAARNSAGSGWGAPRRRLVTPPTDAQGSTALRDLPGRRWLRVVTLAGGERLVVDDADMSGGPATITLRVHPATVVRGHVRMSDGAPVPGAWVSVSTAAWEHQGDEASGTKVVAAADGSFEFRFGTPRRIEVLAGWPGHDAQVTQAVDTATCGVMALVVDPPAPVRGRIVAQSDGSPVAGARLTYEYDDRVLAVTGPDGTFELRLTRMVPVRPIVHVRAAGFAPRGLRASERSVPRTFRMRASARVEGLVTAGGAPAEGADVVVLSQDGIEEPMGLIGDRLLTDAQGRFAVDVPEGALVRFAAAKLGFRSPPEFNFDALGTGAEPPPETTLRAPPAGRTAQFTVSLVPTADVHGVVVDETDRPIGGAEVLFRWTVAARTRDDGTFRFPWRGPGEAGLRARKPGHYDARTDLSDALAPGAAREPLRLVLVRCEGRVVQGRLIGAGGAPCAGSVQFDGRDDTVHLNGAPPFWVPAHSDSWSRVDPIPIGPDGRFSETTALRHDVHARFVPADGLAFVTRVDWKGEETVRDLGDVRAPAATTLTGAVMSEDGAFVAGAHVRVLPARTLDSAKDLAKQDLLWGGFVATTDADGLFPMMAVPAGPLAAEIRAPGFVPTRRWLAAEDRTLDVLLTREMSIEGVARWRDGGPVEGLPVSAWAGQYEGQYGSATSDADGRFRLRGLAPGDYTVRVGYLGDTELNVLQAQIESVAAGTSGLDLIVDRGATIRGFVVNEEGARVAATVRAGTGDVNGWAYSSASAPDGSFELRGIPPGTWVVKAAPLDAQRRAQLRCNGVTDVAAGATDVRIVLTRSFTLRGRLLRPDQSPVERCHVVGLQGAGGRPEEFRATTDADGGFVLRGLAAGPVRLRVLGLGRHSKLPPPVGTEATAGAPDVVAEAGRTDVVLTTTKNPEKR